MVTEQAGEERLGLEEMIRALRSELWLAAEEGGSDQLRFDVGPIDLDLQVAVTKGGKGELGVKFWVFTASGGGSYESAHTQRLHLQLTPRTAGGAGWQVHDTCESQPAQGSEAFQNERSDYRDKA
jgi:hypothetical protein